MNVLVCRGDALDCDVIIENNPVQKIVEPVRVSRGYQQSPAVIVDLHFNHGILLKHIGCNDRRPVAANEDLNGVFLHLVAHALDFAFRDHIAPAEHDHGI